MKASIFGAAEAGVYLPAHMNHGKVVYKKQEKSRGRVGWLS